MKTNTSNVEKCLCGSGRLYADCCQRCHAELVSAPTAETLMRSRYAAYVLGLEPYLLTTWHASTRPTSLDLDAEPHQRWFGLEVKRHVLEDEDHATVEFVARYKIGGRAYRLHETSRFVRENDGWLYVDGIIAD